MLAGSSNFSHSGLSMQREFNVRMSISEDKVRYDGTKSFVEGCFAESIDYRDELLELLNQLIRKTSWQEALACACWDMLGWQVEGKIAFSFQVGNCSYWKRYSILYVGILRIYPYYYNSADHLIRDKSKLINF